MRKLCRCLRCGEEEQAGSGLVGVALFLYICGYCAGVSDAGGGAGWLRSGGCSSVPPYMWILCNVQVSPMREEEQAGSGLVGVALFLGILVVFLTLVVALIILAFWR